MSSFPGISPQGRELLALNRFQDSKPFYEEHKETLKALTTIPMRQLMMDLSDTLLEIDEEINVNPVYTVSRIRRDTRFSKNKMLYRENMWLMIRRPKQECYSSPAMWFEFTPNAYFYGIGYFEATPAFLAEYRRALLERPETFRKALEGVSRAGLSCCAESYKKPKEGNPPPDLAGYYQCRGIEFIYESHRMEEIETPALAERLKQVYSTLKPMYRFLLGVHQECLEKGIVERR